MKKISALLFLYRKLINNNLETKTQFLQISLLMIAFLLFFTIGYSISSVYYHVRESAEYVSLKKIIFYLLITILLINTLRTVYSRNSLINQSNIKWLQYYPINLFDIVLVDTLFGLIDLPYLILLGVGFGTVSGSDADAETRVVLILLVLVTILVFYFITEMLGNIVNLAYLLNKEIRQVVFLLFGMLLVYVLYATNSMHNPYLEAVFSKFSFLSEISILPTENSLFLNYLNLSLISMVILFFVHFGIRLIYIHHSQNGVTTRTASHKISLRIPIPQKIELYHYLTKEIKYLMRSKNAFMAIWGELIILGFIYLNFSAKESLNDYYLAIFIATAMPIFMWDNILSNQWGADKSGFGIFLIYPLKVENLVILKNLTVLLIKFPIIAISSLFFGFIFQHDLAPFVFLLHLIVLFSALIFANRTSIINPSPQDLEENAFSQNRAVKFSLFGFIGLLLGFILPISLVVVLKLFKFGLESYFVFISVLALVFTTYLISLKRLTNLFNRQKEKIYQRLIEL